MPFLARFVPVLVAAALLSGCGGRPVVTVAGPPPALHASEVGDVIPRPQLVLADTSQQRFDLARRPRGELTLLFFGYTHCPDVCPTTMADLAAARRRLPAAQRDRVRVVFVTVDPRRDTPAVLRAWLDQFDPTFTGLVGGPSTERVLTALKAPRTDLAASPPSHAGSVYGFLGDRTLVWTGGDSAAAYAADLRTLLT